MKKNLFIWQMVGITFTAVLGTILHFLFQWTNIKLFASISAVNESTWEHMKLVFIPSFIFAIVQSFFIKSDYSCFWLVKTIGIILGTILIPTLFYTLSGSFGQLSAITNIAVFFVAIIISYLFEMLLFQRLYCNKTLNLIALFILIIVLILFVLFSFYPPKIPLFLDPVTKDYGIVN